MKIGFIRIDNSFGPNLRNQNILSFLKQHYHVCDYKINPTSLFNSGQIPISFINCLDLDFISSLAKKAFYGNHVSFSNELSVRKFITNAKTLIDREYNKLIRLVNSLDILHAEDIFSGYICYKINQKTGIPYVFDLHDIYHEVFRAHGDHPTKLKFYDMMEDKIIRSAFYTTCVSDLAKNRIIELYNISPEKILVIRNGTILSKNVASYSQPFRVIYGGLLHHVERVMDFIQAKPYFSNGEVEFYIMGDGPHREEYLDYINKNNIDIVFLGLKTWEKAMKYFGNMQVGVVPGSDHFGRRACCPMKAIDYAACGLPVLIPQSYDFSKYVKEYSAGIILDECSPKAFVEGIRTLMDKTLWNETSKNARRMVEENFLWQQVLFPLKKIYG
jgi:glycosyltransferase involved in cell wall biosynthesis